MIERAAEQTVDAVILDLEDAVAPEQKGNARQRIDEALRQLDFGRTERLVRINGPESEYWTADLAVVADLPVEGIVVPKVETAAQIHAINEAVSTRIPVFAMIETALGVMNIREIANAANLAALLFGAEDLAVDIGATRSTAGWEIFYGRSAVVTAAAAYGLQAVDMVYTDFENDDGLREESLFGRQLGYTGKMVIHPRQVEVVNRAFAPSTAEVEAAERLVAAAELGLRAGVGAFQLNGRMVDRPMILAAEHLLERAQLCQLFDQ